VQRGSLAEYKIHGTPTLLFVDHQGIVKNVWFGYMPERQAEVRDQLNKLFDAGN
jgi:thioredoxin-related protein